MPGVPEPSGRTHSQGRDRIDLCRPLVRHPLTFDPLKSKRDAGIYRELVLQHPEWGRRASVRLPIDPGEVFRFLRFALHCYESRRQSRINPIVSPPGFLEHLESCIQLRWAVEKHGGSVYLFDVLCALWLWWEEKHKPLKLRPRRHYSKHAMRRRRGSKPRTVSITISDSPFGFSRAVTIVLDHDEKRPPGRPSRLELETLPAAVVAAYATERWRRMTRGRENGWSAVETLLGVRRQSVRRLQRRKDFQVHLAGFREYLPQLRRRLLATGVL